MKKFGNNLNRNTYCPFILGFFCRIPEKEEIPVSSGTVYLIGKNGKNIAVAEGKRSFSEIGRGLIGSDEPEITMGLYKGIMMAVPAYRRRFSGIINSVHMIGMKYPISVFWVSGNRVTDKSYALPGLHIYSPSHPSSMVLELSKEAYSAIDAGDVLTFTKLSGTPADGYGI